MNAESATIRILQCMMNGSPETHRYEFGGNLTLHRMDLTDNTASNTFL